MSDQAEYYVRSRMNIGIGTNEARMARQEEYLSALGEKLGARIAEDQAFIEALYEALGPYLTTDMSRGRMINEVWASREYASETVLELAGEHEVGADGFVQPYCDSPLDDESVSENVYFSLIQSAKHYVYIVSPYLILDNEMVTTLCLAAKSGVDVRIITPGIPDKWYVYYVTQSFYGELLRACLLYTSRCV